jgi:hypothetical protein
MSSYNIIIPIVLGFFVVLIMAIKSGRFEIERVLYHFTLGPVLYGAFACFYLGLTGKFLFSATIEDYRVPISLAALGLLWLFLDNFRKEWRKAKPKKKKHHNNS